MKIILILFLTTFLASCSQPNSSVKLTAANQDSNQINFGELSVSVPNTGIMSAPQSMDFASLAYKQTGVQDLIITNSSSSLSLTYLESDFDSTLVSPFIITKNTCLSVVGPRKKCTISFSLSNLTSLLTEQNITSLFKIKGVDVSLTGILAADPTDYSAPVSTISVSPLELNFGSFKAGESKELSVAVKNSGSGSLPFSITTSSNPNVSITSNTCPSTLIGRKNCAVKLKYNGVIAEVKTLDNLIKIANVQITHSAIITSPSLEEPEILNIEPAQPSTTVAINQPLTQTGTIRYTNTGTLPLVAPVSAVSSDNGIVITSISCAGGLARSKTCDINYSINSPLLPSGLSVQNIKLQSGTLASKLFAINLDVTPNEVACSVADAVSNGVLILNSNSSIVGMKVGSDVSQCLLASNSCDQYYAISLNSKSCDASLIACTPADVSANLWNITQAATYSGNRVGTDVSSCNIATCNLNYEIVGKDCTPIACTQLNSGIANVLTVTGNKVSGCLVDTCINEFEKIGNTCSSVACTTANAVGNGITSIVNVATVSGNISDDSCLVSTCNQYYKNALDNKSCSPKLCNELNAGELISLGYNLTAATISGTYNSCTVSCTSPLQQLAADNKSCEDKTPTGTISFAQDYTKILTPNVVNIISSNAAQLQFYSDAACVTAEGSTVTLPVSTMNLTLSPGNGVKNLYAKFINGTKSSACSTDTIVLDQTAPSLAITMPSNNANIAENSLTVSGTCSETNVPTVSVEVTINWLTQNVNCSSGTFSSVFNITSLVAGPYTISASATDLSTNTGTTSSSFNRNVCTSLQTLTGNTCVDKTPTGSIAFVQNYTKILSGNLVDITQTNAQQIQFYSNAACTTTSGLLLSMPLTQTSITVLSGDGTKTAYAKLINGSASSSCLSDSIILDTTVPSSFTITLPVNTTSSATAAPSVNFSSNLSTIDSGSGVYSVEYGIGTSIGNANFVSFFMIPNSSTTFLATVANGYLPPSTIFLTSTNYYTIIRVRDNAGNERIVSSAAWTYVPVVAYNGDIFAFSSTYNMVTNSTSLIGVTAASFGADNYTLSPLKLLTTNYTYSGTTYDRIRNVDWNGASGGRCGLGMLSTNGLGNTSMPMSDTANASIKIYTKAECKDRAAILFRVNANLLREIKPVPSQEVYYFSIAP